MLELDDITVIYNPDSPAELHALHHVSLHAPTGQFITIVGANGSGKSTLVGVLAGTVTPNEGNVAIDGVNVTRDPVHRRAKRVARVFDDPRAGTAPELSIEDNLALAIDRGRRRWLRAAVTGQRRQHMRDALAHLGLGLEDRLDQPVGLLSAGQRQSLTMIMATLQHPSILLLDEHLAALDPATAERVLALTTLLANQTGATTIMITHDMNAALTTGDRLLIMGEGTITTDLTAVQRSQLTTAELVALLRAGPTHAPASSGLAPARPA